tara:strand:+ start:278 stop:577 length:300 start_codon:yes stop_codon:yes gene_type:complete
MFHIELNHSVRKKKLAKKFKEPQKRKKQVSTNWTSTLMTNYRTDNEYLKPNWDESVDRFDDMGLKEETLRGIYGYGFNKPSPIQCKGILPVIQGHDTIA